MWMCVKMEFIISDEQLNDLEEQLSKRMFCMQWQKIYIPIIRSRPLSEHDAEIRMMERERVLVDYCKWVNTHWTIQRIKEYKESLRGEP
jgi:hypothetical protein